jgi:diguanylate cyclase (GGDEF)-like protein
MLCLPLIADTRVVGAVSLYSSALSNYQDEHIRLVDTVSRIAADAIEKALRHAEAQTYALTDPLTGLPNSRSLQIAFDKEVTRASRGGTNFQLLVLDLDGFKSVNDTYGHKVGDTVLKDLAGLIKDQMREYDFLARYGGDEFVAIVPETDPADVKRLQRRIEEAVGNYILPVGDAAFARVGISLGSASYPSQGESFDELVVAADKAMYLTKAINRQRARMTDGDPEDGGPQGGSSGGNGDLAQPSAEQPEEKEAEVLLFDESDIVIVEADESHIILSAAIN